MIVDRTSHGFPHKHSILVIWPEENDVQPLHIAAQEGHMEVAQFLVGAGAFVEASDTDEVNCLAVGDGIPGLVFNAFC